jgi:hypothetical protein
MTAMTQKPVVIDRLFMCILRSYGVAINFGIYDFAVGCLI